MLTDIVSKLFPRAPATIRPPACYLCTRLKQVPCTWILAEKRCQGGFCGAVRPVAAGGLPLPAARAPCRGGSLLAAVAVRQIPGILYAPGPGAARRHHALLIRDEAAIGAAAAEAVVLRAPWSIDLGIGRIRHACNEGTGEEQGSKEASGCHRSLPVCTPAAQSTAV